MLSLADKAMKGDTYACRRPCRPSHPDASAAMALVGAVSGYQTAWRMTSAGKRWRLNEIGRIKSLSHNGLHGQKVETF
jgi:hypothetical protein